MSRNCSATGSSPGHERMAHRAGPRSRRTATIAPVSRRTTRVTKPWALRAVAEPEYAAPDLAARVRWMRTTSALAAALIGRRLWPNAVRNRRQSGAHRSQHSFTTAAYRPTTDATHGRR